MAPSGGGGHHANNVDDATSDAGSTSNAWAHDAAEIEAATNEPLPAPPPPRQPLVFALMGLLSVKSCQLSAHLHKNIGKLQFTINQALSRVNVITANPNVKMAHISIRDVQLSDSDGGYTVQGQPRGALVADGLVARVAVTEHSATIAPEPTQTILQSGSMRIDRVRAKVFEVMETKAHFNLLPMIVFDAGDIAVVAKHVFDPTLADVLPSRGRRVVADCNWSSIGAMVCGRTQLFLTRIAKRLSSTMQEHGFTDDERSHVAGDASPLPPVHPASKVAIPGIVTASGGSTFVVMFATAFADRDWLRVQLGGIYMKFTQHDYFDPPFDRQQELFLEVLKPDQKPANRQSSNSEPDDSVDVPLLISHHFLKSNTASVVGKGSADLDAQSSVNEWLECYTDFTNPRAKYRLLFSIPEMSVHSHSFITFDAVSDTVFVYQKFSSDFKGDVKATRLAQYYWDVNMLVSNFLKASGTKAMRPEGVSNVDHDLETSTTMSTDHPNHVFICLAKPDVAIGYFSQRKHLRRICKLYPQSTRGWASALPTDAHGALVMAALATISDGLARTRDVADIDFSFEPRLQPIQGYSTDVGFDIDTFLSTFFKVEDKHNAINQGLYFSANVPLGSLLDDTVALPGPTVDSSSPGNGLSPPTALAPNSLQRSAATSSLDASQARNIYHQAGFAPEGQDLEAGSPTAEDGTHTRHAGGRTRRGTTLRSEKTSLERMQAFASSRIPEGIAEEPEPGVDAVPLAPQDSGTPRDYSIVDVPAALLTSSSDSDSDSTGDVAEDLADDMGTSGTSHNAIDHPHWGAAVVDNSESDCLVPPSTTESRSVSPTAAQLPTKMQSETDARHQGATDIEGKHSGVLPSKSSPMPQHVSAPLHAPGSTERSAGVPPRTISPLVPSSARQQTTPVPTARIASGTTGGDVQDAGSAAAASTSAVDTVVDMTATLEQARVTDGTIAGDSVRSDVVLDCARSSAVLEDSEDSDEFA